MSLDLSNLWRDDAHLNARRSLRHELSDWRASAPPTSRRVPGQTARAALALAFVADVVMVSIAAAVAIVTTHSL